MTKRQRKCNHRKIKKIKKEILNFIKKEKSKNKTKFIYKMKYDIPEEYKRRLICNLLYIGIKCVIHNNYIILELCPENHEEYHFNSHFQIYRKKIVEQYLRDQNNYIFINKNHLKITQIYRLKKYLNDLGINIEIKQKRYVYILSFN